MQMTTTSPGHLCPAFRAPVCKLLNPHRQRDLEHAGDPLRRISPVPSWLCSRTEPCEMNRAREFTHGEARPRSGTDAYITRQGN
jgi:hypothetical protein